MIKSPSSPPPPRDGATDIYHGVAIADPFRPLEDLDSAATTAWARSQADRFEAFLEDAPSRAAASAAFARILDYPQDSVPDHFGSRYFSLRRESLSPQPVFLVRETLDGPPRPVIDPNALSADGSVSLVGAYPGPDGRLVAYTLAEAGGDSLTLRVRDVDSGGDRPEILSGLRFTAPQWNGDGLGFHYLRPANDGRRRFILMHHRLGNDIAADRKIFEHADESSLAGIFDFGDDAYDWVASFVGTLPPNGLWRRPRGSDGPFEKIFDHGIAKFEPIAMTGGRILMATDFGAPRGRIVSFDPARPAPEDWTTIVPEQPDDLIASGHIHSNSPSFMRPLAFVHRDRLVLIRRHDCADRVTVHGLDGRHLHDAPIPLHSVVTHGHAMPDDTDVIFRIADFRQPGAIHRYDPVRNDLTLLRPGAAAETLDDCIVERIEATSRDGTKIPMTVIRHPATRLDGTAATKLYGYGGFSFGLLPRYDPDIVHWVRAGGIFAQANLRGGDEFGRDWYDGGRLRNKQNVFDDFIACAEELIARRCTAPPRLVIQGRSNGGLLVLACMLQRPELFGAVVATVPVTDMLRFHKSTYGALWKSDYGDPEANADDFHASLAYSPLHNVRDGTHYPPSLVLTADHDDRVVPSHAYKFVATLQDKASPDTVSFLRVDIQAGHGAGKPTAKVIAELADIHAFIERVLGAVRQAA